MSKLVRCWFFAESRNISSIRKSKEHINTNKWTNRQFMETKLHKTKLECISLIFFYTCSVFYEEEESSFGCKLWRFRNIIGYDHLLQVFGSQTFNESNKHLFLKKFLEEQPLLACTKHLPDFVSLHLKLVQKSSLLYDNMKVWDMCISDFLQFINKGTYLFHF